MSGRNPKLAAALLLNAENLFTSKNWPVEFFDRSTSTFQRFCERLSIFDPHEQQLLLDISKRFEQVKMRDFTNYLWAAFASVEPLALKQASKIIFMPLLDVENPPPGTKSSSALHYLLKISYHDEIPFNHKFEFLESVSQFNSSFDEHSIVLLVDDFVGSGKVACGVIHSFINTNPLVNSGNLFVLTMVAQKAGVDRILKETGCKVYFKDVYTKAITDHYPTDLAEAHILTMRGMESKISTRIFKEGLSLGYAQSEALVSMSSKTPNNTLPVFWYETETKISPFPRYRKSKGTK